MKKSLFYFLFSIFSFLSLTGCPEYNPDWQGFFSQVQVIPDDKKYQDWLYTQKMVEYNQKQMDYQAARKAKNAEIASKSGGVVDVSGKNTYVCLDINQLRIPDEKILVEARSNASRIMGAKIVASEATAEVSLKISCYNLAEWTEDSLNGTPTNMPQPPGHGAPEKNDFYNTYHVRTVIDVGLRIAVEKDGKETGSCFRSRKVAFYEYEKSEFRNTNSSDDLTWERYKNKKILDTLREIWSNLSAPPEEN